MNQAVAQGLAIGKDLIFTFGPYASIYTREYHPGTDHLMVFGSLFLGLCFAFTLLYTAHRRPFVLLVALLLFLVGGGATGDSLLFALPLVIAMAVVRLDAVLRHGSPATADKWTLGLTALMVSPLGLLPLVKGSLLLYCIATVLLLCIFLGYRRHYKLAATVGASAVTSCVLFWSLSGQAVGDLSNYFSSMAQIVSGYTDAMAIEGSPRNGKEPIMFLAASATILWGLFRANLNSAPSKIVLIIAFSLFLFLSFKGSFVRHDFHAMLAAGSIIIAALLLGFLGSDRRFALAFLSAIIVWAMIDKSYNNTSTQRVVERIESAYVNAWKGFRDRVKGEGLLPARFDQALNAIREDVLLPKLPGTTDLYSYGQSYLIAAGNDWNPRPVFQSYSVYTVSLAQTNAQHLRSEGGPDHILFQVEPIDQRLPSLEDGLSWPALIDNYRVNDWYNGYVSFTRRPTRRDHSDLEHIGTFTQSTGVPMEIPLSDAAIFVKLDLTPTRLGRVLEFIYKPPELIMTLRLVNGEERQFRVVASMMKSGFFLSPLVEEATGFVLLATGNLRDLRPNGVTSMSIMPTYGGGGCSGIRIL